MSTALASANTKTPSRNSGVGAAKRKRAAGLKNTSGKRRRSVSRSSAQASVTLSDLIRFLEGVAIEGLAEENRVTPQKFVATLPKQTQCFAPASKFMEVMDDIASWGEVSVILCAIDGVVEYTGCLPKGELTHDYFRWIADEKICGHLRCDRCGGIAFVERAFMGRPSAFVLFFNRDGGIMFKIFVARDKHNVPREDQLTAFRALAQRVGDPHEGKAGVVANRE